MASPLERAKSHFQAQLNGEMDYIDVPEWGEPNKPLRVYWRPMTLKDQGDILAFHNEGKVAEALCTQLVVRARNEDGSRMFKKTEMYTLMNDVDPDIIARIAQAMGEKDDAIDEDVLQKNSETTSISAVN